MILKGEPYHKGGRAYHPDGSGQCNVSYWGGFVCSDQCERDADQRMKRSIDEHNDPSGFYHRKATRNHPHD